MHGEGWREGPGRRDLDSIKIMQDSGADRGFLPGKWDTDKVNAGGMTSG